MDEDLNGKVRVIVGTYEDFVLGYGIEVNDKSRPTLVRKFANRSHTSSVRCVATRGKYMASGGADENTVVCDLERMKESGSIMNHNGTVNSIVFSPDACHVISGADEGTIAVIRVGSWVLEKSWKCAHKIKDKHPAPVTGLAIHPSGKVLLSIGKDKMIRTWNMVTGRPVHFTNVSSRCNREELGSIVWSTTGNYYAVHVGSLIDIYSVNTAGIACSITVSGKATSLCFLEENLVCIGEDSGVITIYELKTKPGSDTLEEEELIQIEAHKSRIKCICPVKNVPATGAGDICFVTAGSDGTIVLWKLEEDSVEMLHEVKTGCRITCMDVVNESPNVKKKKPKVKVENGVPKVKETPESPKTSEMKSTQPKRWTVGSRKRSSSSGAGRTPNSDSKRIASTRGKWIVT